MRSLKLAVLGLGLLTECGAFAIVLPSNIGIPPRSGIATSDARGMGGIIPILKVGDCPSGASTCDITIHVLPLRKRGCIVIADPPVVVVHGPGANKPQIVWKLDAPVITNLKFRFDVDVGVEFSTEDKDSMDDYQQLPTRTSDTEYRAIYKPTLKNKLSAYNYNVLIERSNDGGTKYAPCGNLDPIIINRE